MKQKSLKLKFENFEKYWHISSGVILNEPTLEARSSGANCTRIMKIVSKFMLGTHLKSELLTLKLTY